MSTRKPASPNDIECNNVLSVNETASKQPMRKPVGRDQHLPPVRRYSIELVLADRNLCLLRQRHHTIVFVIIVIDG